MTDRHHECPSGATPFLIGGAVGVAVAQSASWKATEQLRREVETLTGIERERLAEERKRLAFEQVEAQRNEAARVYRQSVLWLEHCNNDERLKWLVRGQGMALAGELAVRTIAEVRKRPEVVALFDDVVAARHALETAETTKRGREAQRDELRERRWSGVGVWFIGAVVGLVLLIPFWAYLGAVAVAGYALFLTGFAGLSPMIVRWQPTPNDLAPRIPGGLVSGRLREAIARVEETIKRAEAERSSATIELALAREAVMQAFRRMQAARFEDTKRHLPAIRARIETLQAIYPPRIRCDLAAVSNEMLHAQLAPYFPAAIERGVAGMM